LGLGGRLLLLATSSVILRRKAVSFTMSKSPQIFVVGNEAADVDSLVSAYAMAQLLNSSVSAVALAQIPREEFRLRGDAVAAFREAGSKVLPDGSPMAMTFWDEVDWTEVDQIETRSLVLVDHNKMTDQVAAHFKPHQVRQVLDHHAGGIAYPDASNMIDESLGSCCSLVVEEFAKAAEAKLNKELGTLLASAILLDCRNFDPDAKKGTTRDVEALGHLKSTLGVPVKDDKSWYKELMEARKDVSHLSVRDLMLLDTKVVSLRGLRVAVCSIFGTAREVISMAGSPIEVAKIAKVLAKDRGYDAVILLFSKDKSMGKRRALAFIPMGDSSESTESVTLPSKILCADIAKQMCETPGNLPETLRENPLYQTQGLVENGFEMQLLKELQPLDVYTLRGEVSRKTVLPFATMVAELVP